MLSNDMITFLVISVKALFMGGPAFQFICVRTTLRNGKYESVSYRCQHLHYASCFF